ncbi:MAG: transcriptional repressor [Actinomycetales bacterium]|nr:transcriptional repressor [Actinomycetales bacterium]
MDRDRFEDILSALRADGKRVTVAKRAVARVLVEQSDHLSAEEVTKAAQRYAADLSPSTVYRILEEMERLDLVVHAHVGHAATVYHLAGAVHGHLVCTNCGVTIEIPSRHFDALSADLLKSYDFRLDRHHVAIAGLCARCRES